MAAAAGTMTDPVTADFVAAMSLSETDSVPQVGDCACVYIRAVTTASSVALAVCIHRAYSKVETKAEETLPDDTHLQDRQPDWDEAIVIICLYIVWR